MSKVINKCKCGCGQYCNKIWGKGHCNKGKNHPMYGKHHKKKSKINIGKDTKKRWRGTKYKNKVCNSMSNGAIKRYTDPLERKKASELRKKYFENGGKASMQGKHHSKKTCIKIGKSNKGKKRTKKTCKNISKSHKDIKLSKKHRKGQSCGQIVRWAKTTKKRRKEIANNISKGRQGMKFSKKHCEHMKGKKSKEACKNMRIGQINRILKTGISIAFNKLSILFYKKIDKKFNLKSLYGKREKKLLGYSLDFYNSKINLVIEWNEHKKHFNKDGTYSKWHKTRQKNIKQFLKCKFINIRQRSFFNDKTLQLRLFKRIEKIIKNKKEL